MAVPLTRLSSGRRTISCIGALLSAAWLRPTKPTSSTGPAISSVVYSARRRAKLRGWSTCHRKLKLSSTFLMVPTRVQASSARPTEPTTPLLTRLANCTTLLVSRVAASPPTGRKNS